MNKSDINSRRRFVKIAVGTLAAIPVVNIVAAGDEIEKLSEDDPQASALGYTHDSSNVDSAKYPNHKATQLCLNCMLYQAEEGSEWGACTIFVGKQVAAKGWCAAYAPMPA